MGSNKIKNSCGQQLKVIDMIFFLILFMTYIILKLHDLNLIQERLFHSKEAEADDLSGFWG